MEIGLSRKDLGKTWNVRSPGRMDRADEDKMNRKGNGVEGGRDGATGGRSPCRAPCPQRSAPGLQKGPKPQHPRGRALSWAQGCPHGRGPVPTTSKLGAPHFCTPSLCPEGKRGPRGRFGVPSEVAATPGQSPQTSPSLHPVSAAEPAHRDQGPLASVTPSNC